MKRKSGRGDRVAMMWSTVRVLMVENRSDEMSQNL